MKKVIRNPVAKNSQSSGSGYHGKTKKAQRKKDKKILRDEINDNYSKTKPPA